MSVSKPLFHLYEFSIWIPCEMMFWSERLLSEHMSVSGWESVLTVHIAVPSMFAGMTSEGGGAVAFPVMTLVLSINPTIARDFSMMIQAFGMTCAALSIFFMRIQLEWSAIILCTLGSWIGMVLGFHVIDPQMSPPQKKMYFVSIWFAFAFTLFLLNRLRKRRTFPRVPMMNWWKVLVLLVTGMVGGIFTSFAGSGLDICTFSVLTLLFRVSEKVATPTSVVLMGGASIFGFYWRAVMMVEGPDQLAWDYLAVCIPVVVIGAPCGALLGTHFHRLVLAFFVYLIDTAVLVTAFVLVKQTPLLAGVSVAIIIGGFIFFLAVTYAGQKLLAYIEEYEKSGKPEVEKAKGAARDSKPSEPNGGAAAENGHSNYAMSLDEKPGTHLWSRTVLMKFVFFPS